MNGVISYSGGIVAPHSTGIVATYQCNEGYRLVGEFDRTCVDGGAGIGGQFNGAAPVCERKALSTICKVHSQHCMPAVITLYTCVLC